MSTVGRESMAITEIERLAARAVADAGGEHPCHILGHKWKHIGGRNACCDRGADTCVCSVPVHDCEICGDCDYGDNDEANEIRSACERD